MTRRRLASGHDKPVPGDKSSSGSLGEEGKESPQLEVESPQFLHPANTRQAELDEDQITLAFKSAREHSPTSLVRPVTSRSAAVYPINESSQRQNQSQIFRREESVLIKVQRFHDESRLAYR